MEETKLVLVYLLSMGKNFYFLPNEIELEKNDYVICETTRGIEFGQVVNFTSKLINVDDTYPKIIKKANQQDLMVHQNNMLKAKEASEITQKKATDLNLDMQVLTSEYMFDRTKIIIYYISDNRVDFRDLLKELASDLHCRIELRQIGARDKAKMIGGIGVCGLKLCCSTFLNEFDGISITMAKNQMLALNIPKLSGQCGKLMCCLKYENDAYTELQKDLPRIGSKVRYDGQVYKITSMNVITKTLRLENRDGIVNVLYDEIKDNILPRDTPVTSSKETKNDQSN